jgi:hypothetical protein
MDGRTGKQIRDRYLNKLRPGVKSGDWNPAEDQLLLSLYYQIGNKWSKIATYMPGRTEGQVKNRFYSHVKKKLLKLDSSDFPESSPDINGQSPNYGLTVDTSNLGSPNGNQLMNQVISPVNNPNLKNQPRQQSQPIANLRIDTFGNNEYDQNSNGLFNRPPVQIADPADMISFDNHNQNSGHINHKGTSLQTEYPTSPDSYFANFSTNHSYTNEKEINDAVDSVAIFFEKNNSMYSASPYGEDSSPTRSDAASNQEKMEKIELLNKRKRDLELLLAKTRQEISKMNPVFAFEQGNMNNFQ